MSDDPNEPPTTLELLVNAVDVDEYTADSKGRITIGSEHAGETVTVALIESTADETGGD